jgi:hypothetical protein
MNAAAWLSLSGMIVEKSPSLIMMQSQPMITGREIALVVAETLQRFRTELQNYTAESKKTSSPGDFAAYNKAFHRYCIDILRSDLFTPS